MWALATAARCKYRDCWTRWNSCTYWSRSTWFFGQLSIRIPRPARPPWSHSSMCNGCPCAAPTGKWGFPLSSNSSSSQTSRRSLWMRGRNCHRPPQPFPSPPLGNTSQPSPNSRKWWFAHVVESVKLVSEALLKWRWNIKPEHDPWEKQPITTTVDTGAGSLYIPYGG
jgi:hypothetical protein